MSIAKIKNNNFVYIILHNIRSIHNVGAFFRTGDALGVSKIFLTGYTPKPVDRFGNKRKDLSKTALGSEETIEWEYFSDVGKLIEKLKRKGVQVVAIEQDKNSVDYKKVKAKYPIAFLVGNEVKGISKQILKKCDVVAEILMKGKKESLNVSVAGGVAMFRILNI
ncbi:TrmH family RNA methyltransferase [Patescibacteria group bacterium]